MRRVLLIEDNQELVAMMCDFFEDYDIEIDYASNGEFGLKLAQESFFDIILLDLMLPRMDGFTVCNMLRKQGNSTPILMLTALDTRNDLLKGFGHGADDYLTKPFDFDILYARMHALVRRARGDVAMDVLSYGEVRIDVKAHKAYRGDILLTLNPTTYAILKLLVTKAPYVVTKKEIGELLWQDEAVNNELLRSHIYQLRNQLDKPFAHHMLKTVTKIGFSLEI